jgi:hypothetical protein
MLNLSVPVLGITLNRIPLQYVTVASSASIIDGLRLNYTIYFVYESINVLYSFDK